MNERDDELVSDRDQEKGINIARAQPLLISLFCSSTSLYEQRYTVTAQDLRG